MTELERWLHQSQLIPGYSHGAYAVYRALSLGDPLNTVGSDFLAKCRTIGGQNAQYANEAQLAIERRRGDYDELREGERIDV